MQAYEFNTTASDGFIKIPEQYTKKIPSNVSVIVIADQKPKSRGKGKQSLFPDFGLNTEGYKFNREEANER
jgi:hypothetical protein